MRKHKLWWCGIAVFFLAGGFTALGAVVEHEPSFYLQSQIPPSGTYVAIQYVPRNFGQMLANRKQETWGCDISEAELNSFFEEAFDQIGETEGLATGISAPSVILEKDSVRLAFRYGRGMFSTVISYDLKIWLVPEGAERHCRANSTRGPARCRFPAGRSCSSFRTSRRSKTTRCPSIGTKGALLRSSSCRGTNKRNR